MTYIAIRHLNFHSKFVADVDIFLPARKTAADAYLLEQRLLLFAKLGEYPRRNIEGEAYVLSLAD